MPSNFASLRADEGWIRAVALSPDRKQLCWLTLLPEDTLNEKSGVDLGSVATFWVTKNDGSDKRQIARIELPTVRRWVQRGEHSDWNTGVPHGVSWTCDGKQITYVHNTQLWSIKVDTGGVNK